MITFILGTFMEIEMAIECIVIYLFIAISILELVYEDEL